MSGNFGQVSLSPPRIAINPNRLYPIEPAIRQAGRFAVNVMPVTSKDVMIRLIKVRRREPDKATAVGLEIQEDDLGIPFVDGAMRTIFCEVERVCETGDHTLIIGRVLESRLNPRCTTTQALLYPDVAGDAPSGSAVRQLIRTSLGSTGALDLLKRALYKRRPPPPPDIAGATYQDGGQTESEIAEIVKHGLLDHGRRLRPPPIPRSVSQPVGICVVGTGWGSFHCDLIRKAAPSALLYVCGRDPERTQRLAKAVNASGMFLGLDAALKDDRVQAVSLALPHDLHREAAERAAAAGKHVLVEKPIATTLADAQAMIEAARRAGTFLMVAEDMHFRPVVREAAKRITRGNLGEPLYMLVNAGGIRRPQGWSADKTRMGGGVLIDIGVHYIRGLRLLMGEPDQVIATRAMQVNTKIGGEDSVQLLLSSSVGWQAHMLLSWASTRGHLPDIVVAGEKGTLHLWPGEGHLDFYRAASGDEDLLDKLLARVLPSRLQRDEGRPERIDVADPDRTGYESEMREFLSAVAEQRQPTSLAEDGKRDLEIVLCGYDALASGARTPIPASTVP